jgi:hypothetical protein
MDARLKQNQYLMDPPPGCPSDAEPYTKGEPGDPQEPNAQPLETEIVEDPDTTVDPPECIRQPLQDEPQVDHRTRYEAPVGGWTRTRWDMNPDGSDPDPRPLRPRGRPPKERTPAELLAHTAQRLARELAAQERDRNRANNEETQPVAAARRNPDNTVPKKRGRPVGSKNKSSLARVDETPEPEVQEPAPRPDPIRVTDPVYHLRNRDIAVCTRTPRGHLWMMQDALYGFDRKRIDALDLAIH